GIKTDIAGYWTTKRVQIGVKELLPGASLRVCSHSPDGFNWGYGGSGPAQLALAILLEVTRDERFSVSHHQAFKWDVIARLPTDNFTLPIKDVHLWLKKERR
ncbi:unnamed protein product, partial [marine sediment metagenome]